MADGFSDQFHAYLPPTEETLRRVITGGLVSLDTNVLLDAYRYAPASRRELIDALRMLGDRLWVSHQAALEFHRNRVGVIVGYRSSYRDALEATARFRASYTGELASRLREFANRIALPDAERDALGAPILAEIERLTAQLTELQAGHGVSDRFVTDDPVLEQWRTLLAGKVGLPFDADRLAEEREIAANRDKQQVPPGYADKAKDEPHGDYFVWRQSLDEARRRGLPLVLVTRDVKDDWFWRVSGKTVGARTELAIEAAAEGIELVLMTPSNFLHRASQFLDVQISRTTLDQAEPPRPVAPLTRQGLRASNAVVAEVRKLLRDEFELIRGERAATVGKINPASEHYPREHVASLAARMENVLGAYSILEQSHRIDDDHIVIDRADSEAARYLAEVIEVAARQG